MESKYNVMVAVSATLVMLALLSVSISDVEVPTSITIGALVVAAVLSGFILHKTW